jgi:hypothetical protein
MTTGTDFGDRNHRLKEFVKGPEHLHILNNPLTSSRLWIILGNIT